MESNIEIVIRSDGKKVMMQCHGKDTSKERRWMPCRRRTLRWW